MNKDALFELLCELIKTWEGTQSELKTALELLGAERSGTFPTTLRAFGDLSVFFWRDVTFVEDGDRWHEAYECIDRLRLGEPMKSVRSLLIAQDDWLRMSQGEKRVFARRMRR